MRVRHCGAVVIALALLLWGCTPTTVAGGRVVRSVQYDPDTDQLLQERCEVSTETMVTFGWIVSVGRDHSELTDCQWEVVQ